MQNPKIRNSKIQHYVVAISYWETVFHAVNIVMHLLNIWLILKEFLPFQRCFLGITLSWTNVSDNQERSFFKNSLKSGNLLFNFERIVFLQLHWIHKIAVCLLQFSLSLWRDDIIRSSISGWRIWRIFCKICTHPRAEQEFSHLNKDAKISCFDVTCITCYRTESQIHKKYSL